MTLKVVKTFGYVLLFIGLISIFIAFRSMQDIFNSETNPPAIFQAQSLTFSVSAQANVPATQVEVTLTPDIRKTVNILLYLLFMVFVVVVGGKISSLGLGLIKEKNTRKDLE